MFAHSRCAHAWRRAGWGMTSAMSKRERTTLEAALVGYRAKLAELVARIAELKAAR